MFTKALSLLRRQNNTGDGAGSGEAAIPTGAALPQRPAAHPPERKVAAYPPPAGHRNGAAHTHGHPHQKHSHHGHAHNHHSQNGNGSGIGSLAAPARTGFPRSPVAEKEISVVLPAKLAVNEEGHAATTVSVHCDRHDKWKAIELTRHASDGSWHGKIPVPESTTRIHYFFQIDGSKVVVDPAANRVRFDELGHHVGMKETRY